MDNNCQDYSDSIIWSFNWNSVLGTTKYQIYVIGPITIIPLIDTIVTSTSFNFSDSTGYIACGNRIDWTWRVRAGNDRDELSAWSEWSFDLEPLNTDCPIILY
jgi:hypothetical protein